jgi:hypothetical protein
VCGFQALYGGSSEGNDDAILKIAVEIERPVDQMNYCASEDIEVEST